jgi:hypothetical protein
LARADASALPIELRSRCSMFLRQAVGSQTPATRRRQPDFRRPMDQQPQKTIQKLMAGKVTRKDKKSLVANYSTIGAHLWNLASPALPQSHFRGRLELKKSA